MAFQRYTKPLIEGLAKQNHSSLIFVSFMILKKNAMNFFNKLNNSHPPNLHITVCSKIKLLQIYEFPTQANHKKGKI